VIGLRTLLHVAADWPGHFPNAAAVVKALIDPPLALSHCIVQRRALTRLLHDNPGLLAWFRH
jgi:hypothetical protein